MLDGARPLSVLSKERAELSPEAPFLFTATEAVRFREAEERATALAAALAHQGIEVGDRVAILLPGCVEFVYTFLALQKLGAVAVPLDPRLTESEVRYLLRHAEATALVTVERFGGADFLERLEAWFPQLPELQFAVTVGEEDLWYDDRIFQFEDLLSAGRGKPVPTHAVDPDAVAVLLYTAGVRGKPKGICLSGRSLVSAAAGVMEALGVGAEDRVIGVTGLFHVFALGPGILGALVAGSSLILQPEFEAEEALDLVAQRGATIHFGVPTIFAAELRAQRRRPRPLHTLRLGLVAGAPMPEELRRGVEAELCPLLLTAYSLTETSSILTLTRPADPEEKRRHTVGRPLPGFQIQALGPEGEVLPEESLGLLQVSGPGVMRGYHRQPEATGRVLSAEGSLLTGDLGMVDEDGYLHLVGRGREVILRGGSNLHPGEIEARLLQHPAVAGAVVVGIRDELLGEAVCAAVVLEEGALVQAEELKDWCGETLADHKIPDFVRFLDTLPLNGTGQVRRVELVRILEDQA